MTATEALFLIAGTVLFLLVYLVILVNSRKKSSEIDKKIIKKINNDKAMQQQLSIKNTSPIEYEPHYQLKPSVKSLREKFLMRS